MNKLDKIIDNCDKEIELLDQIIESKNKEIELLDSMIGILDRLSNQQTKQLIKTNYIHTDLTGKKALLDLAKQNKL